MATKYSVTRKIRKSTKKAAKVKRAVRSLKPKQRAGVTAIVNRLLNRKSETLYAGPTNPSNYETSPFTAIYGSVYPTGGTPQLFTCIPQIAQGDATYERQGNKVFPTRHTTELRFVFNNAAILIPPGGSTASPVSQAGWDINVHVWYGFAKRFKRVSEVITNEITLLQQQFQDGQGNSHEWNGLLTDETLNVDREIMTLKHKKFRMYKNAGLANAGDVTAPSLSTPMSECHRMTLKWNPPKALLYGEEGNLVPENYAPFIIVGYCHNDATVASNTANSGPTSNLANIPAVLMYKVDKLYYKDM